MHAVHRSCLWSRQVELEMAFKLFDKDGSGYITKEEAVKMLTTTGQVSSARPAGFCEERTCSDVLAAIAQPFSAEEMDMFLSMVDVSSDGRIGEDEFRRMECWKVPEIPRVAAAADSRTGVT